MTEFQVGDRVRLVGVVTGLSRNPEGKGIYVNGIWRVRTGFELVERPVKEPPVGAVVPRIGDDEGDMFVHGTAGWYVIYGKGAPTLGPRMFEQLTYFNEFKASVAAYWEAQRAPQTDS